MPMPWPTGASGPASTIWPGKRGDEPLREPAREREAVDDDRGVAVDAPRAELARQAVGMDRHGGRGPPLRGRRACASKSRAHRRRPRRASAVARRRAVDPRALRARRCSWRSTSFGSPTTATSAGTCQPMRVGVGVDLDVGRLARSRSAAAPKCSPLQNRKPTASTTSARPVNGFFHAPRTASGWSSGSAPWPARRV